MASTKERYSLQIIAWHKIKEQDEKYVNLGRLMIAIPSSVTFAELIEAAKQKIAKKVVKYTFNYEEQTGLQIFARSSEDDSIDIEQETDIQTKWAEIVGRDEQLGDYIIDPLNEGTTYVIVHQSAET